MVLETMIAVVREGLGARRPHQENVELSGQAIQLARDGRQLAEQNLELLQEVRRLKAENEQLKRKVAKLKAKDTE